MVGVSFRAPLDGSAERLERMRLTQLGQTPCDVIAGWVEEAREHLMEAAKRADHYGEFTAHLELARILGDIDDLRAKLAEGGTNR